MHLQGCDDQNRQRRVRHHHRAFGLRQDHPIEHHCRARNDVRRGHYLEWKGGERTRVGSDGRIPDLLADAVDDRLPEYPIGRQSGLPGLGP